MLWVSGNLSSLPGMGVQHISLQLEGGVTGIRSQKVKCLQNGMKSSGFCDARARCEVWWDMRASACLAAPILGSWQ